VPGASRKEEVLAYLGAAGFELVEVETQSFDQEEKHDVRPLISGLKHVVH